MRDTRRPGMEADPRQHSAMTSESRLDSLGFALAGCAWMLRHQTNTRIMLLATIAVVAAGVWLDIDPRDWALLTLAVGLVWAMEFANAAIEAAVDLHSPQRQPLARVAKDAAAGAVLLASLTAALVGAFVFLPALSAMWATR